MGATHPPQRAVLDVEGGITSFSYDSHVIRFRTSPQLKRYLRIKTWDKGYLVVDADYEGLPSPTEEYIDLQPILENLYFDAERFVEPIEEVVIAHV